MNIKILFLLFLELSSLSIEQSYIDISNYTYPTINTSSSDEDYVIAIMGTNDIHSFIFPQRYTHPSDNGTKYLSGGAEYLYPYLKIFREEWGNRLLYLNAGDQFDGGVEFILSNGEVMNTYLNYTKLDGASLGNHEFSKGLEFLKNYMNYSNFAYIDSNLINTTTDELLDYPKLVSSKIYNVGNIKVGVIGLITKDTPKTSGIAFEDIIFEDYIFHIKEESSKLKDQGVDSIILLVHIGPNCDKSYTEKYVNKIWLKEDIQDKCDFNEFIEMVEELEPDEIDGIIAGHSHNLVHKWINGIPIISSTGSEYTNILYLHFELIDGKYKLKREETQIEGPLPACEKIFKNNLRCEYRPLSDDKTTWEMSDYIFHGTVIKKDEGLSESLSQWKNEIEKMYDNHLFHSEEELARCRDTGECALYDLIADATKIITGADFSIYNPGGFRTDWHPGDISEAELFMMFPFSNKLVTIEMTGKEIKRMIEDMQFDSLYPTSGFEQVFVKDINGYNLLVDFRLFDDIEDKRINETKTYKVAMNDFLANGGDNFSKVRKWYDLRGYKEFSVAREMFIVYLHHLGNIEKGSIVDPLHPRIRFVNMTEVELVNNNGEYSMQLKNKYKN